MVVNYISDKQEMIDVYIICFCQNFCSIPLIQITGVSFYCHGSFSIYEKIVVPVAAILEIRQNIFTSEQLYVKRIRARGYWFHCLCKSGHSNSGIVHRIKIMYFHNGAMHCLWILLI